MSNSGHWALHSEWVRPGEEPVDRALAESTGPLRVVGIAAVCELAAGHPAPNASQSFSVTERITLDDGRRVVLDRRGFTLGAPVGSVGDGLTEDLIKQQVLNVVLPDNDETADAHPWAWLAELADRRGSAVTVDELKALRCEVVIDSNVTRWLAGS